MVVCDPPFITREVWEKYTAAVKILLPSDADGKPMGNIFCSTIDENKDFMKELLDVDPIAFRPSIPNLVYQYSFYVNFKHPDQDEKNPEINMVENWGLKKDKAKKS